MLGFFGAAGLGFERIVQGLDEIQNALGDDPVAWGANLIHSPNEPALENRVAALFIERGVPCVEAAAFMKLSSKVLRFSRPVRVSCSL